MEIIFILILLLQMFMPYIIALILSAIIIRVIITERIGSKLLKVLIIIVIGLYATIIFGNFSVQTPDDLYIKTKEINDNRNLIGLSQEEVIGLLGKPRYEYTDRKDGIQQYVYSAGKIRKESYWGQSYTHDYYELNVFFDEIGKVTRTSIKLANYQKG